MTLTVRPFELKDIPDIVDYFVFADREYLIGMGADPDLIPERSEWISNLEKQRHLDPSLRESFYMIWEVDGKAVGHCNINKLEFGSHAFFHLHMRDSRYRSKGLGSQFLRMSIPELFDHSQLQELFCEPMASNPGPNHTLPKLGFEFIKQYETKPGWINLHQTVNRYRLSRANMEKLLR